LPFRFFVKYAKKRYSWNILFRFYLVIKLQVIPMILLLVLLYKVTKVESLFILINNFIWLIWLLFVILFPLIYEIRIWRKLIWVFANYVFALAFLLCFGYLLN